MKIEELNEIVPTNISEDYIISAIRNLFIGMDDWFVSYCNPPSGSWKKILLKKDDYIYRQVGAKRGVRNYKRPDIGVQCWGEEGRLTLLLIEAKLQRNDWDDQLPKKLQRYYEGFENDYSSYGVRGNPFRFKRKLEEKEWETIESEEERIWFQSIDVNYIFGFVYKIGLETDYLDLSNHKEWMSDQAKKIDEPVFFMGLVFTEKLKPKFLFAFSEDFPEEKKSKFEDEFPTIDPSVYQSSFKDDF